MCSNYRPARDAARLKWLRNAPVQLELDLEGQIFPGGAGVFLPNSPEAGWQVGAYGLLPYWADVKLMRSTYNCRSETAPTKPSFRNAWKHRQFCLIACDAIYEPSYETGVPIRHRIERADGQPFALAGLWEERKSDPGLTRQSFSMLTINADEHPLMRRFHKPGDEKRSVVMLPPAACEEWLTTRDEEAVRALLRPFNPDEYVANPDPLPPQKKKAAAEEP